jgi:hypothetical protein
MSEELKLPIPPELERLLNCKVRLGHGGVTGKIAAIRHYVNPAGDAHGTGWYIEIADDFGNRYDYSQPEFCVSSWQVVK